MGFWVRTSPLVLASTALAARYGCCAPIGKRGRRDARRDDQLSRSAACRVALRGEPNGISRGPRVHSGPVWSPGFAKRVAIHLVSLAEAGFKEQPCRNADEVHAGLHRVP